MSGGPARRSASRTVPTGVGRLSRLRSARAQTAGLAAGLVGMMAVVAVGLLSPEQTALVQGRSRWSVPVGLLIVIVLAFAVSGLGFGQAAVDPSSGTHTPWLARTARLAVPTGSVIGLVVTVLVGVPFDPGLSRTEVVVVRGVLWVALGVSLWSAVRPRPPGSSVPVLLVLVPLLAVLLATGLVAVLDTPTAAIGVLSFPLLTAALAGIAVVPTTLVGAAVTGLQDTNARGRRISRLIERRPYLVWLVLGVNVMIVVALVLGAALVQPGLRLIGAAVAPWVVSTVIAAALVLTLTLDRRLRLTEQDHLVAARVVTAFVAAPLSVLVLGVILNTIGSIGLHHPVTLGCAVLLIAVAVLTGRGVRRAGAAVPVVVLAGIGLSVAASLLSRIAPVATRDLTPSAPGLGGLILILAGSLAASVAAVVVFAIVTRRTRLLIYLAAVFGWVLLIAVLGLVPGLAPTTNLDLALMGLLAVATALWLAGRQRAVDGFEVVLTVAVITPLWLGPLALNLAPGRVGVWTAAVGILLPGAAAILGAVRGRDRPPARTRRLSLTCLSYGLLAALVWTVGGSAASLPDNLTTALASFVLLPLALLLILAASAGRTRLTAGP